MMLRDFMSNADIFFMQIKHAKMFYNNYNYIKYNYSNPLYRIISDWETIANQRRRRIIQNI